MITASGFIPRYYSPLVAYKHGVSHIPSNRERYGLILDFTVQENCLISRLWEPSFTRDKLLIAWSTVKKYAQSVIQKFNVAAPGVQAPARSISSGNRQRLLVGCELSKNSKLIVAVHSTKGLDIASTLYVRELLAKARDKGKALLPVSAGLEEILQLNDRIAVKYEGRSLAVGRTDEFALEKIRLLMGGVEVSRHIKPGV